MLETTRAETRLKAAVIDRLFSGDHVDADSVLISEMTIANWSRRADIVLANGKLWAFELKSDADRLTRLPGQLATFSYYFEKLVVVVASRFEEATKAMLTDGVGLWVEEQDGVLKERIRPKALPLTKEASIALMTASELRRLLSCNGVPGLKDAPRDRLELLAMGLPPRDLANAARDAVKRRHRARHNTFVSRREGVGTIRAMTTLRRAGLHSPIAKVDFVEPTLPLVELADNHPQLLHAPAGPVLKRFVG